MPMPVPMPQTMPGQPPMGAAAPAPTAPPGGPQPGAMGGAAGPLAMLARGGMGGAGGSTAAQLMTFMAGMGAASFAKFLHDLRTGGTKEGKTTGQKEATANPAQTQVSPQLLQQLAMRRAQAMQPSAVPGAMQQSPMAGLMGR